MKLADRIYLAIVSSFVDLSENAGDEIARESREILSSFGVPLFLSTLALLILDVTASLFALKLKPFHTLSSDKREEVLRRLINSRFFLSRMVYLALKAVAVMGYYSLPRGLEDTGYTGGCLKR